MRRIAMAGIARKRNSLKIGKTIEMDMAGSGGDENKREAEASRKLTHHQSKAKQSDSLQFRVFDLSKSAHRENLKRSLVGVGGLEGRVRHCLALTTKAHV